MSGFELPSNTSVISEDGQTNRQWLQWLDRIHVICAAEQQSGTTADRPAKRLWVGRRYFDTTINAPVFWDGSAWQSGGGGGGVTDHGALTGLADDDHTQYHNDTRGDARYLQLSGVSEAVDDRVAALLVAGTNIALTYDDGAGTLTIDASGGGASPVISWVI